MEEITQLSDDVIEQIKDFNNKKLTKQQNSLINKLFCLSRNDDFDAKF